MLYSVLHLLHTNLNQVSPRQVHAVFIVIASITINNIDNLMPSFCYVCSRHAMYVVAVVCSCLVVAMYIIDIVTRLINCLSQKKLGLTSCRV